MDRLTRMTRMNYDGMGGAREYIMKIVDMTSKQSELKILIAKSFLVHHALNSMPSEFDQLKLKTSYNAQKGRWNISELIFICDREEKRILRGSNGM